ncbi:MAG: matrixin family metalloprotease [Vicinamibacterales bacterium]
MRRVHSLATALILLGIYSSSASAYVTNGRWVGTSATMRLSGISFPAASPEQNAIIAARDAWNLNPSPFRFSLLFNDLSVSRSNSQNEIWITPGLAWPAVTYPVYNASGDLIEADIVFNDDKCWAFNPTAYTNLEGYGTNCRLMAASAIHELGHALGLAHEADEYNVMGNAWTHVHVNGTAADAYVGEDASDGAVALYGLSATAGEDVSVSHWKYDAAGTGSSAYSRHMRVQLYDAAGVALGGASIENGATRFDVTSGQTIQVEFTYENSGRSTQTPEVRLVLSTNNLISVLDTTLTTQTPTIGRNDVYTRRYTVTLPGGLAPGFMWIGAILDPSSVIAELDETNNATWIPVDVQ